MRKKRKDPINENYLMEMMAGNNSKKTNLKDHETEPPKPISKNELVMEEIPTKPNLENKSEPISMESKDINISDYEHLFFQKGDTSARDGKSVYIRPEFHRRIVQIVQVIGEDKISIYNYLDNLLEDHFNRYEKEIKKAFKDKYKPIF